MQHTLNEFMVELLQDKYDTPRKPVTYEDLCWYSLTVYTVSVFASSFTNFINFVNLSNNNPQVQMPKTRYHLYQKAPPKLKRKQKNQDTSVTLNNVLLSFEKATPINYNRNNLFTP